MILKLIKLVKWNLKRELIKSIFLLVLDVDGVLTDGKLIIDSEGNQTKNFSVKDGLGMKLLIEQNIKVVFMSGGKGGASEQRALGLGIHKCLVNVKNKGEALGLLQKEYAINPENTAFIGDDVNDISVRNYVKLLVATADASIEFKKISDLVLINKGGDGAVREFTDRMLKRRNPNFFSKKFFIKND